MENNLIESEIELCKSSFAYFAKKYLTINNGTKLKPLNNFQIEEINEYLKMMDKGYELRLIHLRKGSKYFWCKKERR